MNFPFQLIMRNTPEGCIWQCYEVQNDKEVELLTRTARANGFIVQHEPAGYSTETWPGWRDTEGWQSYLNKS